MNNNLVISLNKNKDYKEQLLPALHKAIQDPHKLIVDNGHISAWIEEGKTDWYLFYKSLNMLTICREEKYSKDQKPFNFQIDQIKQYEDFIPNTILKVNLEKNGGADFEAYKPLLVKIENEFKKIEEPTAKEKKHYKSHFRSITDSHIFEYGQIIESTSLKKNIKNFNEHLLAKGYLEKPIDEQDIEKSGEIMAKDSHVIKDVNELLPQLIELRKLTSELGYSTKKRLTFNDGDSQVWIPDIENGIGFSSQGISFIAVSKNDDKDWQINHYKGDMSRFKTEKSIIKAMVDGNIKSEDRVLLIKDNVPTYVGDGFECMLMDVEFSLEAINEIFEEKRAKPKAKKKM